MTSPVQITDVVIPDHIQVEILEYITEFPSDLNEIAEHLKAFGVSSYDAFLYVSKMEETGSIYLTPRLWAPTVPRVRPENALVRIKG